jgi:hypothetical protein
MSDEGCDSIAGRLFDPWNGDCSSCNGGMARVISRNINLKHARKNHYEAATSKPLPGMMNRYSAGLAMRLRILRGSDQESDAQRVRVDQGINLRGLSGA